MKALCAIVFVLSSFTISAQAQNFSGAIIEPATMSARTIAQIVATEPTVEELSPADRVTTIGSNAAKETPVEVIEPSDATQIAEHSTRSDSKLTDEAIASSAMPLRSVEAIEPRNATQISEHAAGSDSELMDEASAPSTTPARIVVTEPMGEDLSPADHIMIVGPNAAKDSPVEASDTTEGITDREAIE